MENRNYELLVGRYDDETAAKQDFEALRAMDDVHVVASVVLSRNSDGKVEVKEHGGRTVGLGAGIGGVAGLVIGLFAPPLLLTGVIGLALGAGVGAITGEIVKRHEEKEIGVDAEEWLPAGSSAVVAVVDDRYLDRLDKALEKADKRINKAIDKGDYEAVVRAISKSDDKILQALES